MTPEARAALLEYIEIWTRYATLTPLAETQLSVAGSPLCRLFVRSGCNGCPIKEKTGLPGCNATPYVGAAGNKANKDLEGFRHDAGLFVLFMQALLPAETLTETWEAAIAAGYAPGAASDLDLKGKAQ